MDSDKNGSLFLVLILERFKSFFMEMTLKRFVIFIFCLLFIFLLVIPLLLFDSSESLVSFNQDYIAHLDDIYDSSSFVERLQYRFSLYSLAVYRAYNKLPPPPTNFNESAEMFEYVFMSIPPYAVVYPTELYYYFRIDFPDGEVSGNLRLVELIDGRFSIGYFKVDNPYESFSRFFDSNDGVSIKKITDHLFKVSYKGRTAYFRYPSTSDEPSRTQSPSSDEIFVSKIRDESGMVFDLYFNNVTRAFYYSLDSDRPFNDDLVKLSDSVYLGDRTGFAYYHEPISNRYFLLAVSAKNVARNNYFDGPFDQVPPYLNLREMIELAYPYTKISRVDMYGNFLREEGIRMAISPYFDYLDTDELISLVDKCKLFNENLSVQLTCLMDDKKRHFHEDSPLFYKNGTLKFDE